MTPQRGSAWLAVASVVGLSACSGVDERNPGIAAPTRSPAPAGDGSGAPGPGGGSEPAPNAGGESPGAPIDGAAAAAAGLALNFMAEPTSGVAGSVLSPVSVVLVDAAGERRADSGVRVTLSLRSSGASARLIGFPQATTLNGLAAFGAIGVTSAGTGYVLEARADGIAAAVSAPFDVEALAFSLLNTTLTELDVVSVVSVPAQPPLLLASTSTNLFRSNDGGARWAPSDFGSPGAALELVADPRDPSLMYAVANPGGPIETGPGFRFVGKSSDGGLTWREVGPVLAPTSIASVAVSAASSDVFACGDRGIFRSTDAGETWSSTAFEGECRRLAFDVRDPAALFALSQVSTIESSNYEVLISRDAGASWVTSLSSPGAYVDLVSTSSGIFLAGPVGMNISRNGGVTWAASEVLADRLVAAPSDPERLYLALGSGVGASQNGGLTFTPPVDVGRGLIRALAVDPFNPARLYVAAETGLSVSLDGGASFGDPSSASPAGFVAAVAVRPGDPATVLVGDVLGVVRTGNGGGTWTRIPELPRPAAFAFHPDNPSRVYVCADGLRVSTDAGETWSAPDPAASSCGTFAFAAGRAFMCTLGAGVLRSADDGATWNPTMVTDFCYSIAASPDGLSVYAGTNLGAFRSTDGGETWQPMLTTDIVQALVVDRADPTRVYAGASCGRTVAIEGVGGFLRSSDAGASWERLELDTCFGEMLQGPSGALYSSAFASAFGVSRDGGITWTEGGRGVSGYSATFAMADDEFTVYVGTSVGLFRSLNGGGIAR